VKGRLDAFRITGSRDDGTRRCADAVPSADGDDELLLLQGVMRLMLTGRAGPEEDLRHDRCEERVSASFA